MIGMRYRPATSLLLVQLGVLLLGACSTVSTGRPFSEAMAPSPSDEMAAVYVYRNDAEPRAWTVTLLFASDEVAELRQGEYTWAYVPPGELAISAKWPALSGQSDSSLQLHIESGRTYYVEITGVSRGFCIGFGCVTTGIGSTLHEVNPDEAADVIERCCRYQKALKP